MTHFWRIRKWLPERFGQPCRILATGAMNTIQIEFGDGVRHIVSRHSVRQLSEQKKACTAQLSLLALTDTAPEQASLTGGQHGR